MNFEAWKAEYQPRIYEDTGAWCYDHEEENKANPENWCSCEFLYTFDPDDEDEGAELALAIDERRAWTWHSDGRICSGTMCRGDYLITEKPYDRDIEVV